MVLVLLIKVVAFYMQIAIVEIEVPKFKDLSELSLALTVKAGAVRATTKIAGVFVFIIKVWTNSWKRLLSGKKNRYRT